ncbi:MFS transporter [Acidobacteriota bacterium]
MTKQERSWILYDWANSAYSIAITTAIFPIFFKNVAASGMENYDSTAWLGYGNSIYTLIIALLAPFLGALADYRGNKKKFFFFFLIIGVIATYSLTFISEGEWTKALFIYIISALGFAGGNIFYDSFLVDVTPKERMDWVSTSGYAYGYIGSTIPFVLGIAVILNYGRLGLASSVVATKIAFIITAIWWFLFSVPFIKHVKQVYYVEASTSPFKDSFSRLIKTFKDIKSHKNVFLFLVAYFFYIDGVNTIIKMATAYGTDIGISANSLLVILLAVQIVAFPFALLYGRLAQRFSAKLMLSVGICVYICITLIAFFLPSLPSNQVKMIMFWVVSMLVASSQGGVQALSRSFYAKLIPKEKSAEFFGFYNIFGKFATIIGPFLVGIVSQIARNSSFGVLSIALLFIAGGLVLTRVQEKKV